MLRKEIHFFIAVCLLVIPIFQVNCLEKKIVLGGKNGWENSISKNINLTYGEGKYGYTDLELESVQHKISDDTDLFFSFENINAKTDETENYEIIENNALLTNNTITGKKALLSRGNKCALKILGKSSALFGQMGTTGSFTIQFWLNPAVCASGENVFFWRSSKNINLYSDYQIISGTFVNGKFQWFFQNVFMDSNQNGYDITLQSTALIIPDKWAHHCITYNEEEGTLEYYINDVLESIAYTTDTGNVYGHYLVPDLGTVAEIQICNSFTGSIDELCITKKTADLQDYHLYPVEGGRFESLPLGTDLLGSKIEKIDTVLSVPSQSDIHLFVRGSDNFYEWSEDYPKWVSVINGIPEIEVFGKYFQIAVEFYSDGSGSITPKLTELTLVYQELSPPLPPVNLYTKSGNSNVTLSWSTNDAENQYGYLVYYGTKSGEYLSHDAEEGKSPIDVGNVNTFTLNSLKNGRIYYFSVATYLKSNPEIIGDLSKEVYERPLSQGEYHE